MLDLLLPGDGHDLLPLYGQDWPALKDEVIMWMEGLVYGRRLRVTATPAGTDPNNAAMAVVRITDSKHPLRYGAGYSARIS